MEKHIEEFLKNKDGIEELKKAKKFVEDKEKKYAELAFELMKNILEMIEKNAGTECKVLWDKKIRVGDYNYTVMDNGLVIKFAK